MSKYLAKFHQLMRRVLFLIALLLLVLLSPTDTHSNTMGTHSSATGMLSLRDEQQPAIAPSGQSAISKIYWTERGFGIKRANPDGTNVETLIGSGSTQINPQYIALDVYGNKMYWTDWRFPAVRRANLDGSNIENIIPEAIIEDQSGIALDLLRNKVYWADAEYGHIKRANLDGSDVEDLVTLGLSSSLGGLALDVEAGKMYWVDSFQDKIQRADLDGSNMQDLIAFGLESPQDIALDVRGGKMYWGDNGTSKIQRANLDGSSVEDLVTIGIGFPDSLALDVHGGKVYWTDGVLDKIQRANLNGSGVQDIVTGLSNRPGGIAVALTCFSLSLMHTGLGSNPVVTPASSIGCPNGRYVAGEEIALTANPGDGWQVGSWSGTSNNGSNGTSNSLVMPAANWQVTVNYARCPCYNFLPIAAKPFFYGPGEREPNNDLAQANGLLISGQTYTGTMPNASDGNDYYKFRLFEDGTAVIHLTNIAPGHNYSLTLRDSTGVPVPNGHSGLQGNANEQIGPLNLTAGLYYIQVNNTWATGSTRPYQLQVIFN